MLIGYARVSTADQHLSLQTDALTRAGCERIFSDVASGAQAERPGLADALAFARTGDTLVVWKLDRFGRSLAHLVSSMRDLQDRGIGFRSVQESIDATSSTGKLVFHVFAAMAEFERDLIRERTHAGLVAARVRGRQGGRPPKLDAEKVGLLRKLYDDPNTPRRSICELLQISSATLHRYARPDGAT